MLASLLGLTVVRVVPAKVLLGLATGQYTLHGGVIRWAAGTPQAGQIVSHLIPAFGGTAASGFSGLGIAGTAATVSGAIPLAVAATPILAGIAAVSGIASTVIGGLSLLNTAKILKASRRTMELAEMNLAVTRAGFATLEQRLTQLEQKLDEIKAGVAAILTLMQIEQRAELRVALDHLNQVGLIKDADVRRELLVHSATTLGKIGQLYEQRLQVASTLAESMACEEYYSIATLAQVRCYAELGEFAMARRIMETMHAHWRTAARTIMTTHLLDDHPEKYLSSQFAGDVSIVELAEWMDFAHNTTKGYAWIDELRTKSDPWYFYKEPSGLHPSRRMVKVSDRDEIVYLRQTISIPAMRKLAARDQALETYAAQYALLEQHQLSLGEFEAQIAAVAPDDQVEGFVILVPNAESLEAA